MVEVFKARIKNDAVNNYRNIAVYYYVSVTREWMKNVDSSGLINIVFIAGVAISFIKGFDLILKPSQHKWLQDKMETITLKLAMFRPFQVYAKIVKLIYLQIVSFIVTILLFSLYQPIAHTLAKAAGDLSIFLIPCAVVAYLTYRRANQHVKSAIEDIARGNDVRSPSLATFTLRVAKHTSIMLGVFVLLFGGWFYILYFVLYWFGISATYSTVNLISLSLVISFPWVFACVTLLLPGLVVITFGGIQAIANALLVATQWLCWRIVEYNKGVFAAIVLIFTVCLGILELYSRLTVTH